MIVLMSGIYNTLGARVGAIGCITPIETVGRVGHGSPGIGAAPPSPRTADAGGPVTELTDEDSALLLPET